MGGSAAASRSHPRLSLSLSLPSLPLPLARALRAAPEAEPRRLRGAAQVLRLLAGVPADVQLRGLGRESDGGSAGDAAAGLARDALVAAELEWQAERSSLRGQVAELAARSLRLATQRRAFCGWWQACAPALERRAIERQGPSAEAELLRGRLQRWANTSMRRLQQSRKKLALVAAFRAWCGYVESTVSSRGIMLRAAGLLVRTRRGLLRRALLLWHAAAAAAASETTRAARDAAMGELEQTSADADELRGQLESTETRLRVEMGELRASRVAALALAAEASASEVAAAQAEAESRTEAAKAELSSAMEEATDEQAAAVAALEDEMAGMSPRSAVASLMDEMSSLRAELSAAESRHDVAMGELKASHVVALAAAAAESTKGSSAALSAAQAAQAEAGARSDAAKPELLPPGIAWATTLSNCLDLLLRPAPGDALLGSAEEDNSAES